MTRHAVRGRLRFGLGKIDQVEHVYTFVTIDSYSESNYDLGTAITQSYPTGPATRYQSFTAVEAILDSCKFYLKKAAGATGNAQAILYAHTGTFGTSSDYTGAALATSDNFDISTLSSVSFGLTQFNFSGVNRYNLVAGTKYCIAFYNNNAGGVYVGQDSSSPSHAGNSGYDYGGHVAQNTLDNCFYVYGYA